jgi:ABC-type dipeptide/oligopeptide/nickel transport system permease subunit
VRRDGKQTAVIEARISSAPPTILRPRRRPTAIFWVGVGVVAAFAVVALLAPLLAPFDPRSPVGAPLQPPGDGHWLGTNDLGQDVLSQLLCGTRATLGVVFGAVVISTAMSWVVGLAAGASRRLELPLTAVSDLLPALPGLPLLLLVLTLVGSSRLTLILALGLISWPGYARVVRSVVAQTRSAPYVEAARSLGATTPHLARYHLLPASLAVLPTKLVLSARYAVFATATLAFFGLGTGGTASWGTRLSLAFADPLLFARPVWPWLVLPPALAIAMLVVATLWVGEGVDYLAHPERPRCERRYRTSASTRSTRSARALSTSDDSVSPQPKSAPTMP